MKCQILFSWKNKKKEKKTKKKKKKKNIIGLSSAELTQSIVSVKMFSIL